jgi:site-specific recombinase XerD
MSLFLTLDYKLKKSEYKKSDSVKAVIRYRYKGKQLKISTGVDCKIKDWNQDYENTRSKNPIKKSDEEFKTKNLELTSKLVEVKDIIHRITVLGDDEPYPDLIKSLILKNEYRRVKSTLTKVHFTTLFNEYTNWFFSDEYLVITQNRNSYRSALKTSFDDIIDFSNEYQRKEKITLLLENITLEWISEFLSELEKNKGYLPSTINKRIKVLRLFKTWLRDTKNISFNLVIPKKRFKEPPREVICFNHKQILELHDFKEFDASNEKHSKYLVKEGTGVLYIEDVLNKSKRKSMYTNYEVYKDMLVWMCITGMRFSDTVNFTVLSKDFISGGDRKLGEIKYTSIKTNTLIYVPIVNITENLFEKYSSGKSADQYLFPLTENGNKISNQKMNKHIKEICRIIGFNTMVKNPDYGSDGLPIEGTDKPKPLWEWVGSHIGRRSFIRYHIEKGTPVHTIKSMTGHTSTRVFEKYFSIIKSDRMKSMDYGYTLDEGFSTIKTNVKEPKIKGGLTPRKKELLLELKSSLDMGIIHEEQWKKSVEEVMNS